jgi:hypothetical protein
MYVHYACFSSGLYEKVEDTSDMALSVEGKIMESISFGKYS